MQKIILNKKMFFGESYSDIIYRPEPTDFWFLKIELVPVEWMSE